jgi:hypothetical protein
MEGIVEHPVKKLQCCLNTPQGERRDVEPQAILGPGSRALGIRAIAIAERDGPDRGINEIKAIVDVDRLNSYPFTGPRLESSSFALGGANQRRSIFESPFL